MRASSTFFVTFCLIATASARDYGQFQNVPDHIRKWFNEQVSPETGRSCCSIADGYETQEQIRNGQYWVLIEGRWHPVPASRGIHNQGNPVGGPVVWYQNLRVFGDDDVLTDTEVREPVAPAINILCFVPGA